jgi:CBS domain-containing protein
VRDIMSEQILTIGPNDEVRLAVQMMLWGAFRHLPVVDEGRLVGVLTEHDVHRAQAARLAQGGTKVAAVMTREAATAAPDDSVEEAARRMADDHIGSLPVVDGGRLVGIVTSYDVMRSLAEAPPRNPSALSVADVMCRAPRSVGVESKLADAVAEMVHRDVRHLPVVDGSHRVVGILSDRDVRAAIGDPVAVLRGECLGATLELAVGEVMTENPITAREEHTLDELADALLDERVGALPVVDESDHLIGIVSYVDILHATLRPAGDRAR